MKRGVYTRVTILAAVLVGCAADGVDTGDSTEATPTEAHPVGITPAEQLAGATDDGRDHVQPDDGIDGDPEEALVAASTLSGTATTSVAALSQCTPMQGYQSGSARSVCVTTVDGKLVEINTANAYLTMRAAAAGAGVNMYVVSGFRTMDQQRYLYGLYLAGRGNLAARPGFSNHQSGLALDLNTSDAGVYSWLTQHGAQYGFRRTVPSEIWHWEYNGSPAATTPTDMASTRCWSSTAGAWEDQGTCLQSAIDNQWYQCSSGAWRSGHGTHGACTHEIARNTPAPTATPTHCYSATLARNEPGGACVQSYMDHQWYQCESAGWQPASSTMGPGGACSASTALAGSSTPATPAPVTHTCFSSTIGRQLAYGTCVQSAIDHVWYQCNLSGWVSASGTSGPAGQCVQSFPIH